MNSDLLVIGSGLAGSIAALRASELGKRVLLVEGDKECASSWAQGGIVFPTENDFESLFHDILQAGAYINHSESVRILIQEGAKLLPYWLMDRAQVAFDRTQGGELDWALEAAHSKARILHVKDHSGKAIMEALRRLVDADPRIHKVSGMLIDLMISDRHDVRPESVYSKSRCAGAYVFLSKERKVQSFTAPAVILATGGFSALFEHSTGARTLHGDGISAAHRAGARTLHMEYVQFHPTSLYIPHERRYLLTEALRGEGAKLLDVKRKSFVDEMAPRDVVARAIHEKMLQDGTEHVWLDLSPVQHFEQRFPAIAQLLKSKGFDPLHDLIPVVPAAHYTLGGVWTDTDGATSIKGLFAAGEVACTGLHGANRLASTSLLEALVYGHRAAEAASRLLDTEHTPFDFQPKEWVWGDEVIDPALIAQDWQLLRRTLWNYVGLTRSEARLQRAERMLSDLRRDVESFYRKGVLSESLIGLRHATTVATLLLYAAVRNKKSLGTHYIAPETLNRL